jgi:hypothetical protein
MRIMLELLCKRLVLSDQFDRDRERARHILIVGERLIVAIDVIVHGTDLEDLGLQRDADGNFLFLAHHGFPQLTLRTVVLATRYCRPVGAHPMTFSARRHAAACGAGSGGSCGASGGDSGLEGVGTFSLRIVDSSITRVEWGEVSRRKPHIAIGAFPRLM